jgi:hypothetical protein
VARRQTRDAFAFCAGDIGVEGPHPLRERWQFGERAHPYATYTDSIEQLRGTAGARQVRVRAETALAAFTIAKQWRLDHVWQAPELTPHDTGDHRLGAITLSHVQYYWSEANELVAVAVGCAPKSDNMWTALSGPCTR